MQLLPAVIDVIFIQLLCTSLTGGNFIEGKIKLRFYKHSSRYYYEVPIERGRKLFRENEGYNKSLPIVLMIHGMAMGADSPFVNGIVDAFCKRKLENDYNIFSVDMPELFENNIYNEFYIGVLSNVQPVGRRIGKFLNEMINLGLTSPENINLIGYSLGAQVAGYVARWIKEHFGKINYIAGLEPAGPGFHSLFHRVSQLTHVSRTDAKITQFFHTNSVLWGTRSRVGTADFVFNDGETQPGCLESSLDCSHIRVPYLFIEAVANPKHFVAVRCTSWAHFSSCQCDQHELAFITFPPDQRAHGLFYLRTRDESPFSLGEAGAHCHHDHSNTKVEN